MNVVRKIEMILVGLAVSLTAVSHVQARPPPAFQDPVSIASDPQFGDQLKTLRRLVQKNGKRGRNDLCVIGQKDDNGTRKAWAAWVIWKQDHSIILWEPGRAAYAGEDELWLSRRYLRVPRDVTAGPDTTDYMVTPDWVASVRRACNKIGQHFTIIKR